MVRKTRRQRGSAYIYKGAYGCAFGKPPLKCQGEATRRNSRYISKAMVPHEAEEELMRSEKFSTIDPRKQYFLYPDSACPLDKTSLIPANGYDRCTIPNINLSRPIRLLFSEDGGQNLHKIQPAYESWPAFFTSLTNLFDGLNLAHTNHVAHCDIKPPNIVSIKRDDGTYHTRFIDFGLSRKTDALTDGDIRLFTRDYLYYPFEIRLYNRQYYQDNWSRGNKAGLVERWMKSLTYAKQFLPEFTYWDINGEPKFDDAAIDQVVRSLDLRSKAGILERVDIYGLGTTLAEVYHRLVSHVVKKIPE